MKKQDGKIALNSWQMEELQALGRYERMDVVATAHTLYIVRLIKREFMRLDIQCRIYIGEPDIHEEIP